MRRAEREAILEVGPLDGCIDQPGPDARVASEDGHPARATGRRPCAKLKREARLDCRPVLHIRQ